VSRNEVSDAVAWYALELIKRWKETHPGDKDVDLARQIGVSKATISDLKEGDRNPGLKTAMGLAAAVGMGWDEFQRAAEEAHRGAKPARPAASDPFPNRTAALALLRGEVPDDVLDSFASWPRTEYDADPPRWWWVRQVLRRVEDLELTLSMPPKTRHSPVSADLERAAGEGRPGNAERVDAPARRHKAK
jgi:transcriptional regulator with XRE-family HTH domain